MDKLKETGLKLLGLLQSNPKKVGAGLAVLAGLSGVTLNAETGLFVADLLDALEQVIRAMHGAE